MELLVFEAITITGFGLIIIIIIVLLKMIKNQEDHIEILKEFVVSLEKSNQTIIAMLLDKTDVNK